MSMRYPWQRRRYSEQRGRQTRRSAATRRPELEPLEDRVALSILFGDNPNLTVSDNNGPVLANAQVRLIFWGTGWNSGGGPALRNQVQAAIDSLNASTYFYSPLPGADLSQYRPGPASRPTRVASFTTTYNSPGFTFTNDDVFNMLVHEFGMTPQFYYYVIPDPNSTPVGCGCSALHTYWFQGANRVYYGWSRNLPLTDPQRSLDDLTYLYSHEMVESITDPDGTALQVNPRNPNNWNEISDGEAQNYSYRVNGVLAQSYWSRGDGKFTVPTGQRQHFYVSAGRVLTVNGDQLANLNDTVTVDVSNGGLRVTLNGEVAQFDAGAISSVVVNAGRGNNVINIERTVAGVHVAAVAGPDDDTVNFAPFSGNLNNILGPVTVSGSSANRTLVNLFDRNYGGEWTMTLDNITTDAEYARLRGLPTEIYSRCRNTRDIQIYTGTGVVTTNVLSTCPGLGTNIHGNGPDNVVNVGNGSLANFRGGMTVSNNGGNRTLVNVLDQNRSGTFPDVRLDTITSDAEYARLTGLGGGTLYSRCQDTSLFQVFTGTGQVTTNVESTCIPTNIAGNGSGHVINFGPNGRLDRIRASTTVSNSGTNRTLVYAYDSSRLDSYTATLDTVFTDAEYVRLRGATGGGEITTRTVNTQQFVINGSRGNNLYRILGTPSRPVVQLNAGAGNDTFEFGNGIGGLLSLNGGGGTNTLDYRAYTTDVSVNLPLGLATGVAGGIVNIQNATGGSGNDVLVGDQSSNVLNGGPGRDLLIAGGIDWNTYEYSFLPDVLVGGDGEDILIGGYTVYDLDPDSLAFLRDLWAAPEAFEDRTANLRVYLDETWAVYSNWAGNTLDGGANDDWYFGVNGYDLVSEALSEREQVAWVELLN